MSDYLGSLNSFQMDILKEIGNVGAGNAVTALSKMLGKKVDMNIPIVKLLEFKEVSDILGNPEDLVIGILVGLSGEINGMMMFLVRVDSAKVLIEGLLGSIPEGEELSEMELSALQEIGNILSSSYLSALSTLINKKVTPSIPFLSIDMAAAILSVPAIEFGKISDNVLFIESIFNEESKGKYKDVSGYFILIPDMPSFDVILKALGV